MRSPLCSLLLFSLTFAACAGGPTLPDQTGLESPWSEAFEAPRLIKTERVRLEPLAPAHNQRDYDAAQGSREHLQTTMQWGGWPSAEMTAADNLGDLERHFGEFERREAYAFTVLDPSGDPCVGCIYLNPVKDKPRSLAMAFWVTRDHLASDLDAHLIAAVVDHIERGWPVDEILTAIPDQNSRGQALLEKLGWERKDAEGRAFFAWRRP
ncbi:MAG: GNAT family N-acetyltransferase [Planctomycetota bacterium]|nr:GNAT family N-acetyltransferase [Planctomycetota bacterium]